VVGGGRGSPKSGVVPIPFERKNKGKRTATEEKAGKEKVGTFPLKKRTMGGNYTKGILAFSRNWFE